MNFDQFPIRDIRVENTYRTEHVPITYEDMSALAPIPTIRMESTIYLQLEYHRDMDHWGIILSDPYNEEHSVTHLWRQITFRATDIRVEHDSTRRTAVLSIEGRVINIVAPGCTSFDNTTQSAKETRHRPDPLVRRKRLLDV